MYVFYFKYITGRNQEKQWSILGKSVSQANSVKSARVNKCNFIETNGAEPIFSSTEAYGAEERMYRLFCKRIEEFSKMA